MFKSLFQRIIPGLVAALLLQSIAAQPAADAHPSPPPARKVLIVMTNHSAYPSRSDATGLWLTELTHFYDVIQQAGYVMDFVSPTGGKVPLDERSLSWMYMDNAAKAHLTDPAFVARLQTTKSAASVNPADYLAIYYTGGHGTMWDFKGNKDLQRVAEAIYQQGGIVSSVCHGAAGLLDLRTAQGRPLIEGRVITGFSNIEETLSGVQDQVPYSLQDELQARGAKYDKSIIPFLSYAVTDGRLVTGQNPKSGKAVANAMLQVIRANQIQ
jgi:putative intracellular protease/amidase